MHPWLIVGLGNPGPAYERNRHNIGQLVLDELADRMGARFGAARKANARVAEGRFAIPGDRVVLAKPNSFMNLSGGPVAQLVQWYDVPAERLLVIHDELDIDFDTLRAKLGGGHGGHNGLRDIIKALGTNEFARLRVGIGRPPGRTDVADFVLQNFSGTERDSLPLLISDAADAAERIVREGFAQAQNSINAARA